MTYLDTNVYIYAFCNNTDNPLQQQKSREILTSLVANNKLIVSEIILYEFAFVSKKLQENETVIKNNLEFLSQYIQVANITQKVIDLMQMSSNFQHSFDAYHISFAQYFKCDEFITFDQGFKQFIKYFNGKVTILK
jgi:predicted nucleic acid-binding protein